jgi:hypothetical protein
LRVFLNFTIAAPKKHQYAFEAKPIYIFLLFDALQYENNLELLLIGVCPETQLRGDEMGSDLPNPTPPFLVSPKFLLRISQRSVWLWRGQRSRNELLSHWKIMHSKTITSASGIQF